MKTELEIHFTPRELEIIKLILLRCIRREIAFHLDIADGTVDGHIKHLYLKTGTHSVIELTFFLLDNGFSVDRDTMTVTYNGRII